MAESILSRTAPPPDQEVRYGPEPEQVMDVWLGDDQAGDLPLVVLVHGGFWRPDYDRIHLRPMANALRAQGWAVASIEYRREPGRPDRTLDDVAAALRSVPGGLVSDGSQVLVGHSAGGHLVLWAAAGGAAPGLRGTLALAPVADLAEAERLDLDDGAVRDFLGGSSRRDKVDPVRMPAPSTPVVIVHGTADATVPLSLSESYAGVHPQARLVRLPGADHFAVVDPLSAEWPQVTAELRRLCAAD